jgi:hypothetical protein
VGGQLVEQAAVRAAGLDGVPARPAGHERLVGRDVQVGRGLVGVVAVQAVLAQDREDVVLVRHGHLGGLGVGQGRGEQ